MNLSVEDIVKEAMAKGQTSPAPKKEENSEPTKLAAALEALASDAEKEAEDYAKLENEKTAKCEKIKEFVDTLYEVV